ncbi:UpxY family transcription antiterminator [Lacihabitans lacunae]|jgi:transcription antitermination factor NusG|uniref:UpxY family transcription antiterminator n=1 Tax=Lacihabitans lacunae TaxID=1028214 RepID=A0ABV7YRL6_9BACT
MKWYVVYTRSRFEKKVEATLLERNFEAYCPKITRRKKWSDRYKNVVEPLFKSYVFVKTDPKFKFDILQDPGVVKFVNFKGEMADVRETDIERIKAMLNDFDHEKLRVESIQLEDRMVIRSGAFIEKEGKVLNVSGKNVILYIEELDLKITIDQDTNRLEKLD